MIKKFSFPKIWFEPMFLTGSLAVFIGAASPPFRIFAGGFPRRLRRRRPAPQNLSGFAAIFDNFKFFYELIITHYSKFFKFIFLEKFTVLAANSSKKRYKLFSLYPLKIRVSGEPHLICFAIPMG